jgi:hypothetical protein
MQYQTNALTSSSKHHICKPPQIQFKTKRIISLGMQQPAVSNKFLQKRRASLFEPLPLAAAAAVFQASFSRAVVISTSSAIASAFNRTNERIKRRPSPL